MMELPQLTAQSRLITYQIGNDETMFEAITNAFRSIDFAPYQQDSTIEEYTKDCSVDLSDWDSENSCRLSTIIWDHPTVLTTDEIQIYEEP